MRPQQANGLPDLLELAAAVVSDTHLRRTLAANLRCFATSAGKPLAATVGHPSGGACLILARESQSATLARELTMTSFGGHPSRDTWRRMSLPSVARGVVWASASEGWYRYGESNPGSKVENLVS